MMFGIDLNGALAHLGYAAVAIFVGLESVGVPLPGETMLITAAAYAGATHHLSIVLIIVVASVAAILGDNLGFGVGWYGGYALLRRYGRFIRVDEARLKVGRYIFMRHGVPVVFFGRFVSILRTYAAFLAGVNRMRWWRFLIANAAGGIVWSALYGTGAYLLGERIVQLSRPFQIGVGVLAVAAFIAAVLFVRFHARRLQDDAEAAFPGPLEGFTE
jgi:membrane protein DedA with SNARE-associated domain